MSENKKNWLPAIFRRVADTAIDAVENSATGAPVPVSTSVAPPPLRTVPAAGPAAYHTERSRLVLAVDATSSRVAAWDAAKRLTDALFTALPGELDVALAVHGGGRMHTFTAFEANADKLRRQAARVTCKAGRTALLDVLAAVLKLDVRVVVYIGDVFEESPRKAMQLAERLLLADTRVIILHDMDSRDSDDGKVFQEIAAITGGAVLPFSASALDELGALLQAVSVLAVGGTELVEQKQETMPAAPLLLESLAASKQLLIGSTKR